MKTVEEHSRHQSLVEIVYLKNLVGNYIPEKFRRLNAKNKQRRLSAMESLVKFGEFWGQMDHLDILCLMSIIKRYLSVALTN